MWAIIALILFCGVSKTHNELWVDLIELNHVRRENSEFDQIIFWKEYDAPGLNRTEFRTIGFFLMTPENYQKFNKVNNIYIINNHTWRKSDGSQVFSTIKSRLYRESWSNSDPERESVKKHWGGMQPEFWEHFE